MSQPVIAVHGGAWAIPENLWKHSIEGVKEAVKTGYLVLQNGGSALDAVERAVLSLEDDPTFNAGTGSVLTLDGQVEMDALIMEGEHMKAGAVAAIKNVKNPVKVARLVLEHTPHVIIAGEGANKFAASHGISEVPPEQLLTEEVKDRLVKLKKYQTTINRLFSNPNNHDTVGCVAFDSGRHVACGTSTGGITAKMPGRVGDSPLIGSGGVADDEAGAISTTGHGEAIARVCLAKTILADMSANKSVAGAVRTALDHMKRRVNGYGGAIAVSSSGEVGFGFSSERMAWAYIKDHKLHYGLHPDQHEIEELP